MSGYNVLLLSQHEAINYKLINFLSITYVNLYPMLKKSSPICYAKSPIDVNTSSHHAAVLG